MIYPRQWRILALAGIMLTGCGTITAAAQGQGPVPDAKAIVLHYLRSKPPAPPPTELGTGPGGLFGDPRKLGRVELSPPSPVRHPTLGATWVACLRTHPEGKPSRDYALFMAGDRIQDARLSVGTDRCAARPYQMLGVFGAADKKTDAEKRRRPGRKR